MKVGKERFFKREYFSTYYRNQKEGVIKIE
jgi:hypothetical protein